MSFSRTRCSRLAIGRGPPRDRRTVETKRDELAASPRAYESFAERHGPTVLLIAGILLILSAIAAVFTGHQLIACGMSTIGLIAIAMAAMLSRMEGDFSLLGLSGSLRPSGDKGDVTSKSKTLDDVDGPADA